MSTEQTLEQNKRFIRNHFEDFAIAFVNEVETPQYIHHRLTVAY